MAHWCHSVRAWHWMLPGLLWGCCGAAVGLLWGCCGAAVGLLWGSASCLGACMTEYRSVHAHQSLMASGQS
jgi:hypothetical protein